MFQFFVSPGQITPEGVVITGSDVNHIKNALRMKSGEQVRVSDQQGGNFLCEVAAISQEQVALKIIRPCAGTELPVKATLFQGLPKGDKMEMIIQKGVELGACEIVPVAMQNCVVKLDGRKAAARQARWQAIAESAAKQSKRSLIPQVLPVRSFAEAVEYAKTLDLCLMPYEQARGMAYTIDADLQCNIHNLPHIRKKYRDSAGQVAEPQSQQQYPKTVIRRLQHIHIGQVAIQHKQQHHKSHKKNMYKNRRKYFYNWKDINVEYHLFDQVIILRQNSRPCADAVGKEKPWHNPRHQPQHIRQRKLPTDGSAHPYCLLKHKPVN